MKILLVWLLSALTAVFATQSAAQWDGAACEKGASYMRESTKGDGEFGWAGTSADGMVLSGQAFAGLGELVLYLKLSDEDGNVKKHLDARCVGKSNDEKVVTEIEKTFYDYEEGGYKTVEAKTATCNQLNFEALLPFVEAGFAGTNSCDAQIILLHIAVQMDRQGSGSLNGRCQKPGHAGWRLPTGKTCLENAEQPQPEGSFAAYLAAHFSAINNEAVKAKEVQDAAILQAALEEAAKKKAAEEAVLQAALEEAAKKKAAEEAVLRLLTCDDCRKENKLENVNTQIYVDENGNKGTLWCNPGPCTLGSALRHGWISGAGTFLPEELVDAATKILITDSETSSSATRSEIFNITLKTLKGAAETSADPKLKSAAAMTTAQIKSNQVANEKSQEDKSGNLVVVEEAPVVEAPVVEAPVVEAPVVEAPEEEAPVEEAPVVESPVVEAPVEEDHHHDDGTEAPVDEGTEAPVEEWDDDCLGMEQCNVPIEG